MALPSGRQSRVRSISTFNGKADYAYAPQSVVITLEDELDISRGDMLIRRRNVPLIGREFEAEIFWMDEEDIIWVKLLEPPKPVQKPKKKNDGEVKPEIAT